MNKSKSAQPTSCRHLETMAATHLACRYKKHTGTYERHFVYIYYHIGIPYTWQDITPIRKTMDLLPHIHIFRGSLYICLFSYIDGSHIQTECEQYTGTQVHWALSTDHSDGKQRACVFQLSSRTMNKEKESQRKLLSAESRCTCLFNCVV